MSDPPPSTTTALQRSAVTDSVALRRGRSPLATRQAGGGRGGRAPTDAAAMARRDRLSRFGSFMARRRTVDGVIIGGLLTLLVITLDAAGLLTPLEFLLYDARASTFQSFLPPPTDKLVHLDVDQGAIEAIGRWPWSRDKLAAIVDELALAKPKVVGLDITLPDREEPVLRPDAAVAATQPASAETFVGTARWVDNDRVLGDSLKRLGCALVPVSLPFQQRPKLSGVQIALRAELARDVNLSHPQLVERLRARGFGSPDLPRLVQEEYLAAWRSQVADRLARELRAGPAPLEALKRDVLKLDKSDLVLEREFAKLYNEARSAAHVLKFSRPIPPGLPPIFSTDLQYLPVPPIAEAAAYIANVEYVRFRDGRVRAVPLFARNGDRMYPQLGLAMACAQLGVDVADLRFADGRVILPRPGGGEVVIPHRAYRSTVLGEQVATFMDVPWWGGESWLTMYDHPDHRVPAKHVSLVDLWNLLLAQRKMAANAREADPALISLLAVSDEAAGIAYAAEPPPPNDVAARQAVYERAMAKIKADETEQFIRSAPAADLDEPSRRFLAAYDLLPTLLREYGELDRRLREGREEMRKQVEGKSVFVGWTYTGAAADFVPTSVHTTCPGVVIHGAIFNGILTGELWRTLPGWVTFLVTGALGACMTAAAAFLTPARALVVAACLMIGYVLLNGVVLFDYGNLVLGAAGPLLCIAGVWQGCTLTRLIVERYQRSRIEGRFRSYVDPALVDYVVENPDQVKLEGQVREMTVCFTDLGNFTPLTARLKEATVPLLNRIFGAMVPEIRKNNGYVNKFLGDGIMFFFGAPRANPDHARDALRTVLDVQAAMREINAELAERGLPGITLRAGINTGSMVVGDAGSEQASDYTVLGDDVNLAARMESANKQLGTTMLVSARTVELAGDDGVLVRPVGQICVVGRAEPVTAFEVLCRDADATDPQRRLAELTRYMVDAFQDARLADCLRIAADLDREFGPSKLTALYRARCEHISPSQPRRLHLHITLAEKYGEVHRGDGSPGGETAKVF
jgi:class 3 adenylate cyclase/CHASE2 domain-containing sensor protein